MHALRIKAIQFKSEKDKEMKAKIMQLQIHQKIQNDKKYSNSAQHPEHKQKAMPQKSTSHGNFTTRNTVTHRDQPYHTTSHSDARYQGYITYKQQPSHNLTFRSSRTLGIHNSKPSSSDPTFRDMRVPHNQYPRQRPSSSGPTFRGMRPPHTNYPRQRSSSSDPTFRSMRSPHNNPHSQRPSLSHQPLASSRSTVLESSSPQHQQFANNKSQSGIPIQKQHSHPQSNTDSSNLSQTNKASSKPPGNMKSSQPQTTSPNLQGKPQSSRADNAPTNLPQSTSHSNIPNPNPMPQVPQSNTGASTNAQSGILLHAYADKTALFNELNKHINTLNSQIDRHSQRAWSGEMSNTMNEILKVFVVIYRRKFYDGILHQYVYIRVHDNGKAKVFSIIANLIQFGVGYPGPYRKLEFQVAGLGCCFFQCLHYWLLWNAPYDDNYYSKVQIATVHSMKMYILNTLFDNTDNGRDIIRVELPDGSQIPNTRRKAARCLYVTTETKSRNESVGADAICLAALAYDLQILVHTVTILGKFLHQQHDNLYLRVINSLPDNEKRKETPCVNLTFNTGEVSHHLEHQYTGQKVMCVVHHNALRHDKDDGHFNLLSMGNEMRYDEGSGQLTLRPECQTGAFLQPLFRYTTGVRDTDILPALRYYQTE
jgi:hypothetical protein